MPSTWPDPGKHCTSVGLGHMVQTIEEFRAAGADLGMKLTWLSRGKRCPGDSQPSVPSDVGVRAHWSTAGIKQLVDRQFNDADGGVQRVDHLAVAGVDADMPEVA